MFRQRLGATEPSPCAVPASAPRRPPHPAGAVAHALSFPHSCVLGLLQHRHSPAPGPLASLRPSLLPCSRLFAAQLGQTLSRRPQVPPCRLFRFDTKTPWDRAVLRGQGSLGGEPQQMRMGLIRHRGAAKAGVPRDFAPSHPCPSCLAAGDCPLSPLFQWVLTLPPQTSGPPTAQTSSERPRVGTVKGFK